MLKSYNENPPILKESLKQTSISLARLNRALKCFGEAMGGFNDLITSFYTK